MASRDSQPQRRAAAQASQAISEAFGRTPAEPRAAGAPPAQVLGETPLPAREPAPAVDDPQGFVAAEGEVPEGTPLPRFVLGEDEINFDDPARFREDLANFLMALGTELSQVSSRIDSLDDRISGLETSVRGTDNSVAALL